MLHFGELLPASYHCAWCGEKNDILVDPGQGNQQEMTEDCRVCCRPNILHINRDPATGQYHIHADRES